MRVFFFWVGRRGVREGAEAFRGTELLRLLRFAKGVADLGKLASLRQCPNPLQRKSQRPK